MKPYFPVPLSLPGLIPYQRTGLLNYRYQYRPLSRCPSLEVLSVESSGWKPSELLPQAEVNSSKRLPLPPTTFSCFLLHGYPKAENFFHPQSEYIYQHKPVSFEKAKEMIDRIHPPFTTTSESSTKQKWCRWRCVTLKLFIPAPRAFCAVRTILPGSIHLVEQGRLKRMPHGL